MQTHAEWRPSLRGHVLFASMLVAALAALVFGWAATAQLSGAVVARGSVIVESRAKPVAHRDGGVVARIAARDGDRVEAGAALITLDATQIEADLAVIRAELLALIGESARLDATARGAAVIAFPAGFAERAPQASKIMAAERALLASQRAHEAGRRRRLGLQIAQLGQEALGLAAQRRALDEQITLIRLELDQIRGLYADGLTTLDRVYALERELSRLTGQRSGAAAEIARARGKITEIEAQIADIDESARLDALRDRRARARRIAELQEREGAALDRLRRTTLVAPQGGRVHELAVNAVGAVVRPAETVLWIIPDAEPLTVEARIAPRDGDQVAAGQPVTLRFSALNQDASPEMTGRVAHMAADISRDERTGEAFYLARIVLDTPSPEAAGSGASGALDLIPGLPVDVFISTGARTALSYFTKPLTDHLARALRER